MTTATSISPPLRAPRHDRSRGVLALMYFALALVIGVLGFAAAMKLTADGAMEIGAVATAIFEIAVIVALVMFRKQWWAWTGVVALFAMFAGYTGYLLYRGAESCGCFGDVHTPPAMTLGIDLFMVALASIVALALSQRVAMIGFILSVAGFAAVAGAGYSVLTTDPLPGDFKGDRAALLVASSELEDVANADLTDPDWLVYIYNENDPAPVMLDEMQAYAADYPDDDALRVRILTATEAEAIAAGYHMAATLCVAPYDACAASGPNSDYYAYGRLPSWTGRQLDAGDIFHVDTYGALDGYLYDFARCCVTGGKPTSAQVTVMEAAIDCVHAGVAATRPGITAGELYDVVHNVLIEREMVPAEGEDLVSSLTISFPAHGHSFGMGWERPWFVPGNDEVLTENMVIGIEAMAGRPGVGSAKFEEDVLITADGAELLTNLETHYW